MRKYPLDIERAGESLLGIAKGYYYLVYIVTSRGTLRRGLWETEDKFQLKNALQSKCTKVELEE